MPPVECSNCTDPVSRHLLMEGCKLRVFYEICCRCKGFLCDECIILVRQADDRILTVCNGCFGKPK